MKIKTKEGDVSRTGQSVVIADTGAIADYLPWSFALIEFKLME